MADLFQRPASDVAADPCFERFLTAFREVAGSDKSLVEKAFTESEGTTGDVMHHLLSQSHRGRMISLERWRTSKTWARIRSRKGSSATKASLPGWSPSSRRGLPSPT